MACPFFVPTERWEGGGWMHPSRLPLGGGWMGRCDAHQDEHQPGEAEVREFCNLGYALNCDRLPRERRFDAVRFAIVSDRQPRLLVSFVGEAMHLPVEHCQLEYDTLVGQWTTPHPDARIQKLADCYLQAYLLRRRPNEKP